MSRVSPADGPSDAASAVDPDDGGVRRVPVAVVIAVVLVAMLALGTARAPGGAEQTRATPSDAAVFRPPADARSSVWVCTGVPAVDDTERELVVANLGAEPAPVEITALVETVSAVDGEVSIRDGEGGDRIITVTPTGRRPEPTEHTASRRARIAVIDGQEVVAGERLFNDERRSDRTIAARTVERIAVSELSKAVAPALLVQPFGADVVVEHGVVSADDISLSPCATEAGPTWNFATGTTVRGAEQYLAIVNPFPSDAVVDVDFVVRNGRKSIDALEVPRRAQVVVRVDEVEGVLRERAVATFVTARTGRVVAEQATRLDDVRGGTGVELTLGAPRGAMNWSFPAGDGERDVSRIVTVANPGELDASLDVTAAAQTAVEPQQIEVAAGAIVTVDVGELVPDAKRYLLAVSSDSEEGVVVGDLDVWRLGVNASGIVAAHGVARPATQWTFAASGMGAGDRLELVASTSQATATPVTLRFVSGGRVREGKTQQVAPGLPVVLELPDDLGPDTAIEISSDAPIAVERVITNDTGYTRSPGIPGP